MYKKVACINLLSGYTPDEIKLTNEYEKLLKECKMEKVAYKHFDYDDISNVGDCNVSKLSQIIEYFGYY